MIDYTDITLKASEYNFDSIVSKVTNDEIKVMLTDKDTGKSGTLHIFSNEFLAEDFNIENYLKVAREKIDLIA